MPHNSSTNSADNLETWNWRNQYCVESDRWQ